MNLQLGEGLALHELRNLLVDVAMGVGRHRIRYAHLLLPRKELSTEMERKAASACVRRTLKLCLLSLSLLYTRRPLRSPEAPTPAPPPRPPTPPRPARPSLPQGSRKLGRKGCGRIRDGEAKRQSTEMMMFQVVENRSRRIRFCYYTITLIIFTKIPITLR